ncbi:hypothetical protein DFH07DRAFT_774821 [Mycena maculata]|uniref:Mid2 domain-containing protein n=1 Tax=Mycena maculata TaxID=230809 RepID=A0AAD7N9Q2_9AGAR|nr:hypothetical protein DFH07DRAFT_774821 [Mycena maculata]
MPPQAMILRLYIALVLLCYVLSHPLRQGTNAGLDRGLGGLLGGGDEDDDPLPPSDPQMNTPLPKPHLPVISSEGLVATQGNSNQASITTLTPSVSTASPSTSTLDSTSETTQFSTTTISSPSTSIPTATVGITKPAPSTPPGEAAEWKVIGITALGIGLVATIMLSLFFFDSWWGFLRAVVGMKRKDRGSEDMIPDWARRDWEFKIASEDGHRYPTLASLESMTKPKQDPLISMSPDPRHLVPMPPPSLYLPAQDPHPLEPLFRRPSASSPIAPMLRA